MTVSMVQPAALKLSPRSRVGAAAVGIVSLVRETSLQILGVEWHQPRARTPVATSHTQVSTSGRSRDPLVPSDLRAPGKSSLPSGLLRPSTRTTSRSRVLFHLATP